MRKSRLEIRLSCSSYRFRDYFFWGKVIDRTSCFYYWLHRSWGL